MSASETEPTTAAGRGVSAAMLNDWSQEWDVGRPGEEETMRDLYDGLIREVEAEAAAAERTRIAGSAAMADYEKQWNAQGAAAERAAIRAAIKSAVGKGARWDTYTFSGEWLKEVLDAREPKQ